MGADSAVTTLSSVVDPAVLPLRAVRGSTAKRSVWSKGRIAWEVLVSTLDVCLKVRPLPIPSSCSWTDGRSREPVGM